MNGLNTRMNHLFPPTNPSAHIPPPSLDPHPKTSSPCLPKPEPEGGPRLLQSTMLPVPQTRAQRRTLSSVAPVDSRSSSINNVWSDGFFPNDQNENCFDNIIATPPTATVTSRPFPRSIPISEDEEQAFPRHRAQRSLNTLLPFRRTRTNSASPTRSPAREDTQREEKEDDTVLTGDTSEEKRPTAGGISSWFTGSSAPLAVGVPIEEFSASFPVLSPAQSSTTSRNPSPERAKLRKRPTMSATPSTQSLSSTAPTLTEKNVSTSRFSFFSSAMKSPEKSQNPKSFSVPVELSDDLLTLNLSEALFPGGQNSADAFSPSAFKNLLTNAEGLLTKLQTAYQVRTHNLYQMTQEKQALNEEIEEAETRARHLKMQLQEMAEKVTMHDIEVATLHAELDAEKYARRREQREREESVKLIRSHGSSPSEPSDQAPRTSEDLGVDADAGRERTRRLRSRMSERSFVSDTSTDAETSEGSVFSRCMSPTALSSAGTVDITPELVQATFQAVKRVSIPPSPVRSPAKSAPSKTKIGALGKIFTTMSAAEKQDATVESCTNCQGGDTAVAWDTVGLLRAENKGLKERVGELEESVEGALDLVRGLAMVRP